MSLKDLLKEVKNLNFSEGEFAITSSAALAVRNLREARDVDVIVSDGLWEELSDKYEESVEGDFHFFQIGSVEILGKGSHFLEYSPVSLEKQLSTAEMIDGLPFVRLEIIKAIKEKIGTEKAMKDVRLIEKHLKE